jgi:hypothetical protein
MHYLGVHIFFTISNMSLKWASRSCSAYMATRWVDVQSLKMSVTQAVGVERNDANSSVGGQDR